MPSLQPSPADRNLLFGILALQMDFIDREALVKGMSAWVLEKAKPLGFILRDLGSLGQDELTLLDALVNKHLEMHGHDPEKSLAAVNSMGTSFNQLHQLADTDIQASLVHMSVSHVTENHLEGDDPYSTRAFEVNNGTSTAERYRVLRPHAKGGLGQVSVALDQELHREVALKEIQNRYADNLENRARFLAEAEITGRLEHPGIVPVYGLGQYADGRPYYAMRFIRGDNLKEAVKRFHMGEDSRRNRGQRQIEFRQLLGRFLDVCNAMAYAHARGVLHRDLKPGNIMLGQYGETLVVDWGLAKLLTQKETANLLKEQRLALSSSSDSVETIMGSAVGTPQFMSPEQSEGRLELMGPASDVYSLGATLFFLLTNKPPFEGTDVGKVLQEVARGEFPKPRQVKADVPAPLEAICLKAMALKPEDRYATPRALANDIEHWLADEPVSAWKEPRSARAMRWARRHRPFVASVGVFLLAAVTALTFSTILISREQALTEEQRQEALTNLEMAKNLAEEKRRGLVSIYVNNGVHQMDDGKMEQAALWFAAALKLDENHPDRVAVHRLRLNAALQRSSKLEQILWHDSPVNDAEFSPDGKRVITAGEDGTAQIWDVRTGQRVGPKLAHQDTVRHASFSPDGGQVITTSNDKTAMLWDADTGKPLHSPLQHDGPIRRAAYSPDGSRVVTVSQDKTAQVWDALDGQLLIKLQDPKDKDEDKGFVYFAAFSPDGRRVVTANAGIKKAVRVWDAETGESLTDPLANSDYVLCASFSPDGERIVTGAKNGAVLIREVTEKGKIIITMWHSGQVDRATFSADGTQVLTVGPAGAQLWDAATGKKLLMPAKAHWGNNPAYSPDGRYRLFWSSNDATVRIRDEATGKPLSVAVGRLDSASLHRAGNRLVGVGADKLVRVWDTASGKLLSPPMEGSAAISRAWLSPNEQQILGHDKLTARIWDARTGKAVTAPMPHANAIRFAVLSADGRRVVTASDDKSLRTWDATTGNPLGVFLDHKELAEHAAFSPDGNLVVSSGRDNYARLWDSASGLPLATPPLLHATWVRYAAFSPDGKQVVTVSGKSARVWEAASATLVSGPLNHTGRIAEAIFSADGLRIVTVSDDSDDRTARLWDIASGKACTPPLEHKDILRHAWFSPDGLRVLTVSDRNARLWDATNGEPITALLEHPNLLDAAFAPDGFGVITVGKDGSVRSWDLPRGDHLLDDLVLLAQLVSGYRLDAARGLEPCPPAVLRESWGKLRATYPEDFRCPRPTELTWHRQEAEDAEKARHWNEALGHLDVLVIKEPAQAALQVRRGKAFVELGKWDMALGAYSRALDEVSDDAEIWYQRGRVHARLGSHDLALSDYTRALALRTEEGPFYLARHLAYFHLGNIEAAQEDFEKASANSPVNVPRIDCWWNNRNDNLKPVSPHWHDVKADCHAAIQAKNVNWWIWRARGLAHGALGEWKLAAADFERATSLKSDDWRAWQGAARAFAETPKWPEADTASHQAIRLNMEDWGSWYLLGISQSNRIQHAQAIESYSEAIKRGAPQGGGLLAQRGHAYNAHKEHDQAVANYTEVLRIHGNSNPSIYNSFIASIYNNRAFAYMDMRAFDKALADYNEALRLFPNSALYRRNRGNLYRQMKEYDKALADYDESVRLEPKNALNYANRGDLHYYRTAYDKAVAAYSEALEINSNYSFAYAMRGRSYAALLEYERAIVDYSEAIRLNPKDSVTHNNRGYAYQKTGEGKKALDDYVTALEINTDNTTAAINLAKLMVKEGKKQEVEEIFSRILDSKEKKVKENPLSSAHRQDLAWVLENLALIRQLGGKLADAESVCRNALAMRENVAQENPKERSHLLSLARCHELLGRILQEAQQPKEAENAYRASLKVREKIVADFPDSAESHNGLAWFLAVCPIEHLRDPIKAVAVASKAVALVPRGNYWNTLGVAQYRADAWKDAIASLDKSVTLNFGGNYVDWLFLAMAHQQLGDKEQARRWYDKAIEAMEKEDLTEERRLFRAEAAVVLGQLPNP